MGSCFNSWIVEKLIDKFRGLYILLFKVVLGEVVEEVIKYDGFYVYVDGLLFMMIKNVVNVILFYYECFEGRGNYGFWVFFFLWIKMVMNFLVMLFRFVFFMGFGFVVSGLLFVFYLIWLCFYIEIVEVFGWYLFIVVSLILGGI